MPTGWSSRNDITRATLGNASDGLIDRWPAPLDRGVSISARGFLCAPTSNWIIIIGRVGGLVVKSLGTPCELLILSGEQRRVCVSVSGLGYLVSFRPMMDIYMEMGSL